MRDVEGLAKTMPTVPVRVHIAEKASAPR